MRDPVKRIGNLIDKQGVSFISSVDEMMVIPIRRLCCRRGEERVSRYFILPRIRLLMRVSQYKYSPKACIYFCDRRFFWGAMLTGTMEVLEDSFYKEMIWQEGDTMYYPEGVTDPDYCVLRFTAEQGRYYSNFSSENFEVE